MQKLLSVCLREGCCYSMYSYDSYRYRLDVCTSDTPVTNSHIRSEREKRRVIFSKPEYILSHGLGLHVLFRGTIN